MDLLFITESIHFRWSLSAATHASISAIKSAKGT